MATAAHDPITTKITWDREISRLVYARCSTCHRQGGSAFSLMNYEESRPWAQAILEEVLDRQMPPWGAVKGFGDFRNDQALTQEQLDLIANWVDGGAPEGDTKDLPPSPKITPSVPDVHQAGEIVVTGDFKIPRAFKLDGLWPRTIPDNASLQITAEFPDGSIEPLLWLQDYKEKFGHPFLLRTPLSLPLGSMIHGVPPGAGIILLPAIPAPAQEHRSALYSPRPSAGTAPRSDTFARAEKSN